MIFIFLAAGVCHGFDIKGLKLGMTVSQAKSKVRFTHGPQDSSFKSSVLYHTGFYEYGGNITCAFDRNSQTLFFIRYTYKEKERDSHLFDNVLAKAIAKYGEPDTVMDSIVRCKHRMAGDRIAFWNITKEQYYHRCYPQSSLPDNDYVVLAGSSRVFTLMLINGRIFKVKNQ
jgi:hypothetical protein